MNWPGDIHCKMCGEEEDTRHVIFNCAVARLQWTLIRDTLSWDNIPDSVESFIRSSQKSSLNNAKVKQKVTLVILRAFA